MQGVSQRDLWPLLTWRCLALETKGRLHSAFVRSFLMLGGNET